MTVALPEAKFSLSEAAKLANVHRTHMYWLVNNGHIEAERGESGQLRISRDELYWFIKDRDSK